MDKFSISSMLSNSSNGKMSAGKTIGSLLCMVGSITLMYAAFFVRDVSIINSILLTSSGVIATGSALILGKVIKPTTIRDIEIKNKDNGEED